MISLKVTDTFTQMFQIDIEYLIFKCIRLKIRFSGKDLFLIYSSEQNSVINLIIIYWKYRNGLIINLTLHYLKIKLKHYINKKKKKKERNKKAQRMYRILFL